MYRAALVIAAFSYIELSGKACPLWGHVCWFVVSGGWEMPLAFRTGDARYPAKQRVVPCHDKDLASCTTANDHWISRG